VPSGEHVVKYTRESSTRTCPGDATLASSTKHRSALQIPIQGALPQIAASTPASSGSGPTGGPLSEHATTRPTNVTKLRRLTDIAGPVFPVGSGEASGGLILFAHIVNYFLSCETMVLPFKEHDS